MSRRYRRYKGRKSSKRDKLLRKYHSDLVDRIDSNPAILNIEGLTKETVVEKVLYPNFKSGKYHSIDMTILYLHHNYEILLLEAKPQLSFEGMKIAGDQIDIGWKYFKRNWKEWLSELKNKLDFSKNYKVWLDNFIVSEELYKGEITLTKPILSNLSSVHKRTKLGNLYEINNLHESKNFRKA